MTLADNICVPSVTSRKPNAITAILSVYLYPLPAAVSPTSRTVLYSILHSVDTIRQELVPYHLLSPLAAFQKSSVKVNPPHQPAISMGIHSPILLQGNRIAISCGDNHRHPDLVCSSVCLSSHCTAKHLNTSSERYRQVHRLTSLMLLHSVVMTLVTEKPHSVARSAVRPSVRPPRSLRAFGSAERRRTTGH